MNKLTLCPCGSGRPYDDCCHPLIEGARAATPEALMRSRYSAFALGCRDYLRQSWHPKTRPSRVSPTSCRWLGLKIIAAEGDSVEFTAYFCEDGDVMQLHERSRFARVDGQWHYLDGHCKVSSVPRNSRCPCGSGRKVKHCCGATESKRY